MSNRGRSARIGVSVALGGVAMGALVACGGSAKTGAATVANGGSLDESHWPADDRSMCEWRGKADLQISETAGPGSVRPNVRRVYKELGEGETRHNVLVCREIDTNLDGIKDVARTFNAKGEAATEKADTNFDGKLDVWVQFVNGRMSEEDVDTNHDGVADIWKTYVDGKLSRIRRDRNFDGKPDVWEIYTNGHLERMGIDDNFDGHVDRWDRDNALREEDARGSATSQQQQSSAAADAGAPAAAGSDAGPAPATTAADGGSSGAATSSATSDAGAASK